MLKKGIETFPVRYSFKDENCRFLQQEMRCKKPFLSLFIYFSRNYLRKSHKKLPEQLSYDHIN